MHATHRDHGRCDLMDARVKTRDWPSPAEGESFTAFPAPPSAPKLIHRWRDRQRQPDVGELTR